MFRITLTNPDQSESLQHEDGPLELGRSPEAAGASLTVCDQYISRRQLCLEQLGDGRVRVQNLGADILLGDGRTLQRGEEDTLALPIRLTRGHTRIDLAEDAASDVLLQTISQPVTQQPRTRPGSLESIGASPRPERLAQWFETLLSVQKSAAGSRQFYDDTARAVVELVGMDRGLVILRQGEGWQVIARHAPGSDHPDQFSRTVLNRVFEQRRTYYETAPDADIAVSLATVEAYVASPILSARHDVVGVVFGSRNTTPAPGRGRQGFASGGGGGGGGISALEAQVVQLLASTVSVGMARVEQEAEAARTHVQLQQFASPELVRELERCPNLLQPTGRVITVLFGDLRGFSRISERLSPQDTYRLVSDVMDELTNCLARHDGFVIDYSGDGIGAMWNAPTLQDDHPARAARAAADMLAAMPGLSARWQKKVGQPLRLGVGLNTDEAQVGNAGSKLRLKYSPLGHAVNLASRVEGATKQLGVPCLITDATRAALPDEFATRRLWPVRVMGIHQPVRLHELHTGPAPAPAPGNAPADNDWPAFRDAFETALDHFEQQRFAETLAALDGWADHPRFGTDAPAARLRKLASEPLDPKTFDPVWNLDRK
jgi:adenylate cyclase